MDEGETDYFGASAASGKGCRGARGGASSEVARRSSSKGKGETAHFRGVEIEWLRSARAKPNDSTSSKGETREVRRLKLLPITEREARR